MSFIIDRRQNTNKKSSENSQRFKERYKKFIKKAVKEAISNGQITDIVDKKDGINISVNKDEIEEPQISNDTKTGKTHDIYTGNKEFVKGQKIPVPQGGTGQGNGAGEGSGNSDEVSEDEFIFQISQKEFLEYFFQELELPDLIKKSLARTKQIGIKKNGFSRYGLPNNLDIKKSLTESIARKIALKGYYDKEIEIIKESDINEEKQKIEIEELENKKNKINYIEENDLRYKINTPIKKPITSAVMFCLMDVSGSVDEMQKELSKRFYILLYLFLKKNYEEINIRFIRYTTVAKDVSEEEFFYSKETGGTQASSALKLTNEIIENEYPTDEWNIYIAHTSDGDNWKEDNTLLVNEIEKKLLPKIQYYAYVEVKNQNKSSDLRPIYENMSQKNEKIKTADITSTKDVYPALKFLFQKKGA